MSLLRKALWPTAIALGFLVFLGAIGQGNVVKTASAAPGEICLIESTATPDDDWIMAEGDVEDFTAYIEDTGPLVDEEVSIDLDDIVGDSDITSVDDDGDGDTSPTGPTDFLDEAAFQVDDNVCGKTDDEILADIEDAAMELLNLGVEDGENCWTGEIDYGPDDSVDATDCQVASPPDEGPGEDAFGDPGHSGINDEDIDCGYAVNAGGPCSISNAGLAAAAAAIADEIFGGEDDCDVIGQAADLAYNSEHPSGEFIGAQIHNFLLGGGGADDCFELFEGILADFEDEPWLDAFITVDVTCEEAGNFELSFAWEGEGGLQTAVTCVGPVDDLLLTADPNKVEIVPAMGSVSYSLIIAVLIDEDLDAILVAGHTVDFKTNRCVFQDEDGLTEAEFESVKKAFDDYDVNDAQSALDLTAAVEAVDHDDADDDSNAVKAFNIDADAGNELLSDIDSGDGIAAIILDCTAASTVPGVATITAEIDQGGVDILKTTTVTVVGPPASPVVVTADQASVVCGDRVQITVAVKDSAGQNVSDHTLVEAVTTFGGVLGGTGAVAGNLGFVVPVSSTLAETFNGVATFFLLTSDTHVGAYDVTISTGGGGSVTGALGGFFSTPVQTGRVSVSCAQPVVAPAATATVTAPRTGQGIVPPNTGDAGLAASSSGLSLLVIAGIAAFALAGVATLKFARR